ncbi:MAG: hypothetical protein VW548_06925, partial [Methylotenera sp.]
VNLYSWPMFMLAISFSAILMTSTIMAAHLPRILELAGATTTMAIAAGALVGPAQVIIRVLHFSVMRKVHPLISARLAVLTHPIGAVLVLVFGAPASYAFAILHGVGNGEITVVRGTLPLLLFGPVGYGRRQGFLSVPTRFAQAIAPFLFAVLIERFGHYVLIVSSGLCLLSFLALLGLKYIPDRFGLETDVK